MRIARSSFAALPLVLAACSSAPAPSPMGTAPAALTAPPVVTVAEGAEAARPPASIDESALNESDRSRDPFRASTVVPTPPPDDQRPRKSKHYSVDQLKLVGVVSRAHEPRAMLVDPRGKGWIVGVGDLVGRAEMVKLAGNVERGVSWRVDRIRESEVVLVREDAETMGSAGATRVLALRHEPLLAEED